MYFTKFILPSSDIGIGNFMAFTDFKSIVRLEILGRNKLHFLFHTFFTFRCEK